MFDPADKAFLATLRAVAGQRLGADHACTQALDRAIREDDAAAALAARQALHALPADVFDGVMAAIHKALREDPSAILVLWRGGRAKN